MLQDSRSKNYQWQVRSMRFNLNYHGLIMGVLNVTPDSFSDGGAFAETDKAIIQALRMIEEGADIIDIGGESTRHGAEVISAEEELARVLPVIRAIAGRTIISIDTQKASVAREAIRNGAHIINDISALRHDPEMLDVLQSTNAGVILMHMQGTPQTMQNHPHYDDVIREVRSFFQERFNFCVQAGIDSKRIVFDPGIGFGKTVRHNLLLLQNLSDLEIKECPLLIGVSRKSFIGKILNLPVAADRLSATIALTALTREKGARIFRVHDVAENKHALRITEATLSSTL